MNQNKAKLILNKPHDDQHNIADINKKSNQSQINRIISGSASHGFGENIPNVCGNEAILNSCMDGFWLIDLLGNILEVNDAYYKMIGYSREELLSMNVCDVEIIESPEEIKAYTNKLLENGCDRFETQHRRKDGTILDIEVAVNHLEIENGFIYAFIRDISERKQAEEKLRRSSEQLNTAISGARVAVWDWNIQENYTNWSKDAEEVLGFPPGSFGNSFETYMKWVHPDDHQPIKKRVARALEDQDDYKSEYRVIRPDASIRWITAPGRIFRDKAGKAIRIAGTMSDITEQKLAEEALLESEIRFRTLVESAPIAIYETDSQGACRYVNKKWQELAGLTLKEALGEGWQKGLHKEDRASLFQLWNKHAQHQKPWDMEYRFCTPEGKVSWVLGRATAVRGADGRVTGYLGVNVDITERKRVEEALRESEKRFRTAITEAPLPIMIHAEDGQVMHISKTWTNITGYTHSDIPTIDEWTSRAYGQKMDNVKEIIDAIFQRGAVAHDGEFKINIESGTTRIWDFLSGPIGELPDGRRIVISMATDITEQKRAEEILKLVNDSLEVRVKERTADLLKANKLLEKEITERKQAEMTLKASEKRYQNLLESLIEGIGIVDENEVIQFCNPAFAKIFEVGRPNNLIGRSIMDFIPENQRKNILNQTAQRKKNILSRYELVITTEKNRIKFISVSAAPRYNEKGNYIGTFGCIMDITNRKLAEDALRESERRLSTHLQNTPIASLECNLNFEVKEWNRAAEKIFGYTKDEAIGKNANILIPEAARKYTNKIWEKLTENRGGFNSTNENITKDGRIITCEWSNTPLVDKTGKVYGVAALVQDITDRKRAEVALRESEEKFSKAFHNNPAISAMSNLETGEFTDVNQAFCDKLGYTFDEVIGKKAKDLLLLDSKLREKILGKLKEQGFIRDEDVIIYDKNGTPLNIILCAEIIEFAGKKYCLNSGIDITDRKQMEDALLDLNEQLMFKHKALEEKNIALKEVLGQIEEDKKKMASRIQSNIDRIVTPVIRRLNDKVGQAEKKDISLIQSSLEQVTIPFVSKLEALYGKLTPREVEICSMIRSGLGSKEIASLLNTSWETVRSQRKHIRKKLGITGQKTSLTSTLRTA